MDLNIESNFSSLCKKSSNLSGEKIGYSPEFSWAKNPYDIWFSRIFDIKVPSASEKKVVTRIIESIKNDNTPDTLLINEESLSDEFRNELILNNFSEIVEQTTMSYELSKLEYLNEDFLNVKIIDQVRDFQKWFKAVRCIFGEKDIRLFELFLKDKEIIFLAIISNGEIVSTTMMFIQNKIAGLHLVGTLKDYRGKGYGSLLTKFALKYATEQGCMHCVLQASKIGKSIYSKVGFNEYQKISHWKYSGKKN